MGKLLFFFNWNDWKKNKRDVRKVWKLKNSYWTQKKPTRFNDAPSKGKLKKIKKLKQKILIIYEDSKIFKKGVQFNVLTTESEAIFNDVKQFVKRLNPTAKKYNFINLFLDMGGLGEGLINTGSTPLLYLDNNKCACLTLKNNH